MKKKIASIFILLVLLLLTFSNVIQAATEQVESSKTTFELVEKPICEMNFGGTGHFTKELTNFDATKKELTITLKVTNSAEMVSHIKPVEIFLVLDNSGSMAYSYDGKTKKDYVIDTANKFIDSIFDHFTAPKIGVVSFSSTPEFIKGTTGSLADARVVLPLSDSKGSIETAVASYTNEAGPMTNIEAGLSLAQSNFTKDLDGQQIIILISDGVPNLCLDTEHTQSYSGVVSTKTKTRLQTLASEGIKTYSVLLGLNENNVTHQINPPSGTLMTNRELAEEIWGTTANPTAGDFYYINYDSLDTTVNDEIFKDITYVEDHSLKNIVIKDYIPQDIMDNFDFMHSVAPNIGTVTDKVDTSDNNSITWTIPELKEGETATLSYKLKLKDTVNKDVLNKVLPTNTKVDIDFENPDGTKDTVTSDVSPKVKILYEDKTVAPDPIPQTGSYTTLLILSIIAITVFGMMRIVYLRRLK